MKKFSNLVDLVEYYPLIVKKDKNFSKELYYVLSSGTLGGFSDSVESSKKQRTKSIQQLKTEQVSEFIWEKIKEKFETIAKAFRFFDIDNNTKLSPKEFREGLERLKIKISDEDRENVFSHLDKDGNGWLSYKEF